MKTLPNAQEIKGSYLTPDGKAQIDFGVTYRNGYPEFTASGHFEGSSGQCLDQIKEAYWSKLPSGDFHDLICMWRDYHCKSLEKANPAVIQALKTWGAAHPFRNFYDTQAETFLSTNGLKLRITLSDTKTPAWEASTPTKKCPACNGEACHLVGIPVNSKEWCAYVRENGGKTPPQFVKCAVCKNEGRIPNLEARKHGHHYRVTVSRDQTRKGKRTPYTIGSAGLERVKCGNRLTFDFWGSIADAQKGEHPSPYDVLACISSDACTPETFADWCAEYGDDTDSIKALQTFRRCNAFAKRLRAFFTPAELEQLAEIR